MGKKNVSHSLRLGITHPAELHYWVHHLTGLSVPTRPVCPHHQAPMEYLARAYFEPAKDLVVWAPRGGGKTRLGAVATLLDLILKPGCQIRILGGSLEQSQKMWEHLRPDCLRVIQAQGIQGVVKDQSLELANGSKVAVLTQSERAVRGLRVQKLRCDEVELFDPQVWSAAQLATKSKSPITAAVEAISTLHAPFGLMQQVVETAEASGVPVLKWCLLEVLERCPQHRACAACPLFPECQGIAKTRCEGYLSIDDAIAMKRRVSLETWESEMLCRRPCVRNAVFSHFDPAIHVREETPTDSELWLAIDFGYANPFVCLWIHKTSQGLTYVVDEYVQEQRIIEEHLEQIRTRPWGPARKIACDPAGQGRNDQTATSNVMLLRQAGYSVKCRPSGILEGLEMLRRALHPAAGQPTLFIHPRCKRLIRALQSYRYGDDGSELPLKDGQHDHLIDALRYYYINHTSREVTQRRY